MADYYDFDSGFDVVDLKTGEVFELYRHTPEPKDIDEFEYSEAKPFRTKYWRPFEFDDFDEAADWIGDRDKLQAVGFHPDNKGMVFATAVEINLIDIKSGVEDRRFKKFMDGFQSFAISGKGKMFAAADCNRVRIWDLNSGKLLKLLYGNDFYDPVSVFFSPDGKTLFSLTRDCDIKRLNTKNWEELPALVRSWDSPVIGFAEDGNFLVGIDETGLCLWDLRSGKRISLPCDFGADRHFSVFNLQNKQIICSSDGEQMALRNLDSIIAGIDLIRKPLSELPEELETALIQMAVGSFLQSPVIHQFQQRLEHFVIYEGKLIASVDKGNTVKVCDLEKGRNIKTLKYDRRVSAIFFSPKGDYLAIIFY